MRKAGSGVLRQTYYDMKDAHHRERSRAKSRAAAGPKGRVMAKSAEKLSEKVAGTIGKRIFSGHYKQGQTLPTEPEVQAEFGVSRTAVREAIRLLSAKGLTASRPKVGTRVRPSVDWNMFDADVLRWQVAENPDNDFVNALFEMGEIIEPSAASLASERASAGELEALGAAMD